MAEEQQLNGHTELDADIKQGRFKIRGSDWLGILTFSVALVSGYILFDHNGNAKIERSEFVAAVKEMTLAQREAVQAQRVMNCLIATDQKDRQNMLSTCERIAR